MNKITITPTDIIEAEWWQRPLHIAEKKGLPVKYKNVFDVKSIDIDWDKVENINMWEDKMNNELIFEWKEI